MRISSLTTMIITATISVLWLDSCCKHKNVVQEDAIELGVSGKATKAIIDNMDSLVSKSYHSGIGFGVFGYKMTKESEEENATTTPYQIFDNVEVNPSNDTNPDWTYSPTRYWDKNPVILPLHSLLASLEYDIKQHPSVCKRGGQSAHNP